MYRLLLVLPVLVLLLLPFEMQANRSTVRDIADIMYSNISGEWLFLKESAYKVGNITFEFAEELPLTCCLDCTYVGACAFPNRVAMRTYKYKVNLNSFLKLCNHELCHIYVSPSEAICKAYYNITVYKECDELAKILVV